MERLYTQIRRVAATDATVLLEGESGTGKELIAMAIGVALIVEGMKQWLKRGGPSP